MNKELRRIGFSEGFKPVDNLTLVADIEDVYKVSVSQFQYIHIRYLNDKVYDVIGELEDGQLRMVVSIRTAVLGTPHARTALLDILNHVRNVLQGG